jgi:hypothetical protein
MWRLPLRDSAGFPPDFLALSPGSHNRTRGTLTQIYSLVLLKHGGSIAYDQ